MALSRHLFHFIILTLILLISAPLQAEGPYERRLSLSEWVNEMVNCEDDYYLLENAEIYVNGKTDTAYAFWEPTRYGEASRKVIQAPVLLRNVKLPSSTSVQLNYLTFKRSVTWVDVSSGQLQIFETDFDQGLDVRDCDMDLTFAMCSFGSRIVVTSGDLSGFVFYQCDFNVTDSVYFTPYIFGGEEDYEGYGFLFRLWDSDVMITHMSLYECTINAEDAIPIFSAVGATFGSLGLQLTDFKDVILDFSNCQINKSFVVQDCEFNTPIGVDGLRVPTWGMNANWNQFTEHGLALYEDLEAYTASSDSELTDVNQYNELISGYKQFYVAYKTRGDMESANACLIAMKDIETSRMEVLYVGDKNLRNLFQLRLNQFLKFFCDYGTSPVKSLVISMYVILIFAFFYFFFYSDWDQINRTFLIRKYRKIQKYFRSEQKLDDFYSEEHKEEFQSYTEFKKELEESKIEVPFFYNALGKPLYQFSLVRQKTMSWLYRRTEILSGRWADLQPSRKLVVGSTVAAAIFTYLVYLGVIRALNSVMLSINTFSTLGFGEIPVKGFTRYIAILEGFLGWFLLSIFSVSLISQILQN